jgi:hypothetical protein
MDNTVPRAAAWTAEPEPAFGC